MITIKKKDGEEIIAKSGGELSAVLAAIAKEKGDKVIFKGNTIPAVERIPTGVFEFDLATGGGIPRARLSIIYGPTSSGKSNICYRAAANAQKLSAPCNKVVWVDLEGSFDPSWVEQFGVNLDDLIVIKPGYGEEAVDLIIAVMYADDVALVVVDSVAMMTATKEIEQSAEKFDVGTSSLMTKRLCNKIAVAIAMEGRRGHEPTIIFCNQTRMKIGVMFGDPETQPGGQTMLFLSALTVRLYGKNKVVKEIHPTMSVFKDTNMVIKKSKVPVYQGNTEYEMAMYAHNHLKVGETDSFKIVSNHLKALAKVEPTKGGWTWNHELFPTLASMGERYYTDNAFALGMQKAVIDSMKDKAFFIDAKNEKSIS